MTLLRSLPGVGVYVLSTLCAEAFNLLQRCDYRAFRARGYSHGRALRTVGDRLLAVACAMLKNGTLYDPKLSRDKLAA